MAYNKIYTASSIKLAGRRVAGRVHLIMSFNYGYRGARGQYLTLKVPTGHAVEPHEWEGNDFTPTFRRKHAAVLVGITEDVSTIRKAIFTVYEDLKTKNGCKPSPDQILAAMLVNDKQATPITMAEYIREICGDPAFNDGSRTLQKYRTAAATIDLLTGIREAVHADAKHPLRGWVKGEGPVMLNGFSSTDWNDIIAIVKRSGKYLTVAARSPGGLVWTTPDQPSAYSVNSLEKFQQNLKAVLHYAQKTKRVKGIDTSEFDKAKRKKTRKPYLTTEEVVRLCQTRFDNHVMERTRKLMVVQVFTGCAIGDLRDTMAKTIHWISGRSFDFPMIYGKRNKTGNPCAIPVFRPLMDALEGQRVQVPDWDQQYNDHLKRTAKALGLDRVFFKLEHRAHGGSIAKELDLSKALASHAMRRTTKNLFQKELQVNRDRVCDMMGHNYGDDEADRDYLDMSPENSAELFIRQVRVMADEVCPELDLIVTRAKEERKRA